MDSPPINYSRRQIVAGALTGSALLQTMTQLGTANSAQPAETRQGPINWQQIRTQWVLNPRLAYFDTARSAAVMRAMLVAEYRALEAFHTDPQGFIRNNYGATAMQSLCTRLARWLDCGADELCFTDSAVGGLLTYAQQLPLQAGDEVILHAQLPQAVLDFWHQQARDRGLVVKTVELPVPLPESAQVVAAFENELSDRSRILMCTHVQPVDGSILPIHELATLARSRGIFSLIDGSFSLGALQFSLHDLACDAYGCSFAHWLNGPAATGLLYLRRDLHAALSPDFSTGHEQLDTNHWPHLASLRPASVIRAATQLQTLPVAMDFQEKLGRARIEARLLELQTYAQLQLDDLADLELLTTTQPGMHLHLLSLRPMKQDAEQLANRLSNSDQIIVSGIRNAAAHPSLKNVLRISLNIYNSFDDIERLVQALRQNLRD